MKKYSFKGRIPMTIDNPKRIMMPKTFKIGSAK